jgi:hypothetical protein
VEVRSVPASRLPGRRQAVQLPRASCHVLTLVACAPPGFDQCLSVSFLRAAGSVVGSVKGSMKESVEGSVQDWSPLFLTNRLVRGAAWGSVASADSLGVVSAFGVDSCGGCPSPVAES